MFSDETADDDDYGSGSEDLITEHWNDNCLHHQLDITEDDLLTVLCGDKRLRKHLEQCEDRSSNWNV